MRALKIPLNAGETEILITNTGAEKPGYEAFAGLYRLRRGVETKYKTVKQKPEPEDFSGLPADNIRQDFYAMMTVANMISGAVRLADTDAKVEQEGKHNQYEYQVNVNHAAGVFKDYLIRVLVKDNPVTRDFLMRKPVDRLKRRVVPFHPAWQAPRKDYSPPLAFIITTNLIVDAEGFKLFTVGRSPLLKCCCLGHSLDTTRKSPYHREG